MADLKKRVKQELSRVDHGKNMASALINGMLQNPDEILTLHGNDDLHIYKNILRDDQVASTFQQRRTAVTQCEYIVEPASESAEDKAAADFITEQLARIDFDDICDKMLYATHYGYSVAELMFDPNMEDGKIWLRDIKVRDRSRFKFGPDNVLYLHENTEKIRLPANKFWVHSVGADTSDNPYGHGLAHSLYWPVYFKRNGIKFWLIFLEKYGMPTVKVTMPQAHMNDPEKIAQAHDLIDAIQVDSGIVVPEEFAVDLIEASRSGTADYNQLYERMDKAISKIVLSQTMTTDDGSSHSQAKVHGEVKDDVRKSDADLLSASFNRQVIETLVKYNFANAKAPRVWRKTEPEEDLVAIAERDNKIINLGYEPTEEYVAETYGPGWRRKKDPIPPVGNQNVELGPEFADVSPLTDKRINHRRNQQSIIDAAEYKGLNFNELIGDRVDDINQALNESADLAQFQEKIYAMMEQPVKRETAENIRDANFFARLLGYFFNKS